jgi:hypothetical protein
MSAETTSKEPTSTVAVRRPWTPDRKNPDGSTTVTVKRCCNGCGEKIGDVSLVEIDAAIAGEEQPDVRGECPTCCPIHGTAAQQG